MDIIEILSHAVEIAVNELYGTSVNRKAINISPTRTDFIGDYTVVTFPFTKMAKKKPEQIGEELGEKLKEQLNMISDYNVVKGFLNISLSDTYWLSKAQEIFTSENFGQHPSTGQKVLVEFSSPNTNKPLHLGHIRNILLGWSTSKILSLAGHEVIRTQIVNDRGIAINKSMVAWQEFGNGETPDSSGIKGDFLVGKYYVKFEKEFQKEYSQWQQSEKAQQIFEANKKENQEATAFFKAYKNTYFNEYSELGKKAKDLLLKWEANDPDTKELWKTMNSWVYQGFEKTYQDLGVEFDKLYYESDTYLLGKNFVEEGLKSGIFYKKEDGSVWIDLESAKMDQKLVLRSDGTSVYITQDIGTAEERYRDYKMDKMVYVVADEQDYHFKVLFEIMKRFGAKYADGLYHLSYGMVDLPSGKMKSREGTVVDADELMADVIEVARKNMKDRNEIFDSEEDLNEIIRRIGIAAMKFFIIKVNPKKRMVFNPNEAVDIQGQTGPYIQYAYVRAKGVYEKSVREGLDLEESKNYQAIEELEKNMVQQISLFPDLILQAAEKYDPSLIANYCYDLAKNFNKFWHELPIMNAEEAPVKAFRVKLSKMISDTLATGMDALGIQMPNRM